MIFDRGTCGCEIRAYTWEEGSNPHDDAATRPIFKLLTPVSQGFETTTFLPLDAGHVVQGACEFCHNVLGTRSSLFVIFS